MSHPMFEALPSAVRDRITEWMKSLEKALGDDLVAILLAGGVARGDYRPGESDVNALVVVKRVSFDQLDAISSTMQAVRYGARVQATILTEEEIKGSCDAFPLLYDEVKRWHIILVGRDPFVDTVVDDKHRLVRIEQELREVQIGLRRAVTDALGAREAIGGAVARRARQIRRPLRALLQLQGLTCGEDLPSVLACAGAHYSVDVGPLRTPRDNAETAYRALDAILAKAMTDPRISAPPSV